MLVMGSPRMSDSVDIIPLVEIIDETSDENSQPNGEGTKEDPAHSVFEEFLAVCASRLRLPDDEKILEKLKKHYKEIDVKFRQSTECLELLEGFTVQVKEQPDTYVILAEVLDNFKSCRVKANSTQNLKNIKKLEKLLEKLDKKIKAVQAKEVNLDDDANSDYILECRLKDRFNKVYAELCKLVGCDASEPRQKMDYKGTRYPEINRNINKYLNKTDVDFPDYQTIVTIITETNTVNGLHLPDDVVSTLAKEAFLHVGSELKQRRLRDFAATLGCHLTDGIDCESSDPATVDADLRAKLDENHKIGIKKIDEVIDKYANEQENRKESPANGDEGEADEELDEEEEDEDEESDDDVIAYCESDNEDEHLIVGNSPSDEVDVKQEEDQKPEIVQNGCSSSKDGLRENGTNKSGMTRPKSTAEPEPSTSSSCQSDLSKQRPTNKLSRAAQAFKRELDCAGVQQSPRSQSAKRVALMRLEEDDIICLD